MQEEARINAVNNWLKEKHPELSKSGYSVGGWKGENTAVKELGNNLYEKRKINPDGSLGQPEVFRYERGSFLGGLGGILKTVAPIALGVLAPGLGAAIGGALGATGTAASMIGGAALGAGTSALTGGTILKGAALGGLGAGVAPTLGGLTEGMNPAVAGAVRGAANFGISGLVRGNFDLCYIGTGALTGGATCCVTDLVNENMPQTGNLEEQIRTPGYRPPAVTGSDFIDNVIRNAAIRTPRTLIRGGNLGDIAVGSLATEAGKTVAGSVPGTGSDIVDSLVNAGVRAGTQTAINTALNGSGGSGGSGGGAGATTGTTTGTTTGATSGTGATTGTGTTGAGGTTTASSGLSDDDIAMLMAMFSKDSAPAEQYVANRFASTPFDVNSIFTAAGSRAPSQQDQYDQLLQMLGNRS